MSDELQPIAEMGYYARGCRSRAKLLRVMEPYTPEEHAAESEAWADRIEAWLTLLADHDRRIKAEAAQQIRDYWDANGDIIDTNNGARLAFEAIAVQIAESP
ncbi:hypothetical protein [Subtercola sp. YIM 133946]|uniref:hypothetical protein n=1 Tax=Subtercola sp. YIM 133946 TaxID=3118909 RepID=UPI002F92D670